MKIVIRTVTNGFAKGRKDAPKRLRYTPSIGDPQHSTGKQPLATNTPDRPTLPKANRPVVAIQEDTKKSNA